MNVFLDNIQNKYAKFDGRADRKEFWMFQLFYYLLLIALLIITGLFSGITGSEEVGFFGFVLIGIAVLALIIPQYAITIRRLHDMGKSGWWILISAIPYLGAFILIILLCLDSEPGANKYGENPKGL